jgi:hypothetical protein
MANKKIEQNNKFTDEQGNRFIEHLTECHSWYKHLPLIEGGEFIIFLDNNAGKDYPTQHPSLPFGNTEILYKKAFGKLNYYWKKGDNNFSADGKNDSKTRAEIEKEIDNFEYIRLYPYISGNFFEAIEYEIHQEDCKKIINGLQHEMSNELISLITTTKKLNDIWKRMSDDEMDLIIKEENKIRNSNVLEYNEIQIEQIKILTILQQREINKITRAVFNLQRTTTFE